MNFKQLQAKNARGLPNACEQPPAAHPSPSAPSRCHSTAKAQVVSKPCRSTLCQSPLESVLHSGRQSSKSSAADRGDHPSRSHDACWSPGTASPRATQGMAAVWRLSDADVSRGESGAPHGSQKVLDPPALLRVAPQLREEPTDTLKGRAPASLFLTAVLSRNLHHRPFRCSKAEHVSSADLPPSTCRHRQTQELPPPTPSKMPSQSGQGKLQRS